MPCFYYTEICIHNILKICKQKILKTLIDLDKKKLGMKALNCRLLGSVIKYRLLIKLIDFMNYRGEK